MYSGDNGFGGHHPTKEVCLLYPKRGTGVVVRTWVGRLPFRVTTDSLCQATGRTGYTMGTRPSVADSEPSAISFGEPRVCLLCPNLRDSRQGMVRYHHCEWVMGKGLALL